MVTVTVKGYAALGSWAGPQERIAEVERLVAGEAMQHIGNLTFGESVNEIPDNYTKLGQATITIELETTSEKVIGEQVASLKEREQKIYAAAEIEAKRIREQIQNLLALEYRPYKQEYQQAPELVEVLPQADTGLSDPDDDIPF